MNDALTAQTVELLQQLIRNQCVNDGTVASGQEVRTSDVLRAYLEGSGLDLEVYEPDGAPGRTSLVARIEGTDPAAPTLCLMGHTDVVPVTPATWTRDPFGGELVNGEVWGRGAVDMLNLTASQAVALKALARREISRLLIEGGGEVVASALEARAVDRAVWIIAPKILGGKDTVPAVGGKGARSPNHAVRLEETHVRRVGEDWILEGKVRFP